MNLKAGSGRKRSLTGRGGPQHGEADDFGEANFFSKDYGVTFYRGQFYDENFDKNANYTILEGHMGSDLYDREGFMDTKNLKGDGIWDDLIRRLPERTRRSTSKLATITVDTLYAVYVVNVEVAVITFFLAIPVFWLLGYGDVLFFSALSGLFQLVPFLGPQILIIILAVYALAIGDVRGALIIVFLGYPLISGVADFYFRPQMMGDRVAINAVLMMIGIFGGLALLGIVGIILGPLLVTLGVAAYHILLEEVRPYDDTA